MSVIRMQNKYLSETLLSITTSTILYLDLYVGNQLYLSILHLFCPRFIDYSISVVRMKLLVLSVSVLNLQHHALPS